MPYLCKNIQNERPSAIESGIMGSMVGEPKTSSRHLERYANILRYAAADLGAAGRANSSDLELFWAAAGWLARMADTCEAEDHHVRRVLFDQFLMEHKIKRADLPVDYRTLRKAFALTGKLQSVWRKKVIDYCVKRVGPQVRGTLQICLYPDTGATTAKGRLSKGATSLQNDPSASQNTVTPAPSLLRYAEIMTATALDLEAAAKQQEAPEYAGLYASAAQRIRSMIGSRSPDIHELRQLLFDDIMRELGLDPGAFADDRTLSSAFSEMANPKESWREQILDNHRVRRADRSIAELLELVLNPNLADANYQTKVVAATKERIRKQINLIQNTSRVCRLGQGNHTCPRGTQGLELA